MIGVKITGLDRLIKKLQGLEHRLTATGSSAVSRRAGAMLTQLKRYTKHPFQEVPSYLLEYKFKPRIGGVVPKRYPPGTQAAFAVSTGPPPPPLVQQYPIGPHLLHELLQARVAYFGNGIIVGEVGYPKGTEERGSPTWYIVWVLFGTVKMLPRPFLQEHLQANARAFRKDVEQAVRTALGLR